MSVHDRPQGYVVFKAAFSELSRKVKPAVESMARLTWVSASPVNPVSVMFR